MSEGSTRSFALARRTVATAVLAAVTLALCSAPAYAARTVLVGGNFAEPTPPVVTAYDPATGAFTGYGTSTWTGTWTGQTHWKIKGTINLLTGDSKGTLDETFIGRSDDGGTGTLHFTETYTVIGATDTFYDEARLLSGTGDFTGSYGNVNFAGLELPTGQGEGAYYGTWTIQPLGAPRPPSPPPARHPRPAPAPRLHLTVAPRDVNAQHRQRFHFCVSAEGKPVAHAWVVLAGHRTQTNRAGRAVLIIALPHSGRYRVLARHPGMTPASRFVRAT